MIRSFMLILFISMGVSYGQEVGIVDEIIIETLAAEKEYFILVQDRYYSLEDVQYNNGILTGNLHKIESLKVPDSGKDSSQLLLYVSKYNVIENKSVSINKVEIYNIKHNIHYKWKRYKYEDDTTGKTISDSTIYSMGIIFHVGSFNPELFKQNKDLNSFTKSQGDATLAVGLNFGRTLSKDILIESGVLISYYYTKEDVYFCQPEHGWCGFGQRYISKKQLSYLSVPFIISKRGKTTDIYLGIRFGSLLVARHSDKGTEWNQHDLVIDSSEININNEKLNANSIDLGFLFGINIKLNNKFNLRAEYYSGFVDNQITPFKYRANKTLSLGVNYNFLNKKK